MVLRYSFPAVVSLALSCTGTVKSSQTGDPKPASPEFACTTPAQAPADFSALNGFGFRLYASLVTTGRKTNENLVVSPLSAAIALGMVHQGATGATEQEISQVLVGSVDDKLDEKMAKLIADSQRCSLGMTSAVANALWVKDRSVFKNDYLTAVGKNYGADVSSPIDQTAIDSWVKQKTHSRIKSMPVDASALVALLNALYLKGTWTVSFDPNDTKLGTFVLEDGSRSSALYMHRAGYYKAAFTHEYLAVRLPFGKNQEASLTFVMPSTTAAFRSFEASFSDATWKQVKAALVNNDLSLELPKITTSSDLELIPPLREVGLRMTLGFAPDLSGMMDLLHAGDYMIGTVRQKTFLEINEKGAEAAAVTLITVVPTSADSGPTPVRFNRPFLVVLEDTKTGVVSFIGSITNPVYKGD